MKIPTLISFLSASLVFFGACAAEHPANGQPCPCGDGFICCSDVDLCIPEGNACPSRAESAGIVEKGACSEIVTPLVDFYDPSAATFSYDEANQLIGIDLDVLRDGSVNEQWFFRYNDDGYNDESEWHIDGMLAYSDSAEFDELGRTVHFSYYLKTVDEPTEYYDVRSYYSGLTVRNEIDQTNDSQIDMVTVDQQNSSGELIESLEDTNADGVNDNHVTWTTTQQPVAQGIEYTYTRTSTSLTDPSAEPFVISTIHIKDSLGRIVRRQTVIPAFGRSIYDDYTYIGSTDRVQSRTESQVIDGTLTPVTRTDYTYCE